MEHDEKYTEKYTVFTDAVGRSVTIEKRHSHGNNTYMYTVMKIEDGYGKCQEIVLYQDRIEAMIDALSNEHEEHIKEYENGE